MSSQQYNFLDSKDSLHQVDVLRARLKEDSYLFFRRLLQPDQIKRVREETLLSLASVGWLKEGTDPLEARPGPTPHFSPGRRYNEAAIDTEWFNGYKVIQCLESFHRLAHDPALTTLMTNLLSDNLIVHPRKIARVSFPGIDYPTPPHQDFTFNQACADVLTVWIPLGDVSRELGGLEILRGSAACGPMKVRPTDGLGGERVDVDDNSPDWRSIDYKAGDVLLFHGFSVHRSKANRSDRLRLSADYRYQSATDPIKPDTLQPHGYGRGLIPSWKALSANWSSRSWIDVVHPVRIVQSTCEAPKSRLI